MGLADKGLPNLFDLSLEYTPASPSYLRQNRREPVSIRPIPAPPRGRKSLPPSSPAPPPAPGAPSPGNRRTPANRKDRSSQPLATRGHPESRSAPRPPASDRPGPEAAAGYADGSGIPVRPIPAVRWDRCRKRCAPIAGRFTCPSGPKTLGAEMLTNGLAHARAFARLHAHRIGIQHLGPFPAKQPRHLALAAATPPSRPMIFIVHRLRSH